MKNVDKIILFIFSWSFLNKYRRLKSYSNIIQNYVVSPNELVKEEKYIKNNIALTREAYQLNNVFASNFPASNLLTRKDLDNNNITSKY